MRPKAIIHTDEDALEAPDANGSPTASAGLSAAVMAEIERALANAPDNMRTKEKQEELRAAMIKAHQQRMSAAMNGAGSRY
jgi:hypothetical protein